VEGFRELSQYRTKNITFAAENGTAVILQANIQFNGQLLNYGNIDGGLSNGRRVAIATTAAVGSVRISKAGSMAMCCWCRQRCIR
jgi:hypothetical protein